MYLFIFNGIYAVIANTKQEAKEKLCRILPPYYKWFLKDTAECKSDQGRLIIAQKPIVDDVIVL